MALEILIRSEQLSSHNIYTPSKLIAEWKFNLVLSLNIINSLVVIPTAYYCL